MAAPICLWTQSQIGAASYSKYFCLNLPLTFWLYYINNTWSLQVISFENLTLNFEFVSSDLNLDHGLDAEFYREVLCTFDNISLKWKLSDITPIFTEKKTGLKWFKYHFSWDILDWNHSVSIVNTLEFSCWLFSIFCFKMR